MLASRSPLVRSHCPVCSQKQPLAFRANASQKTTTGLRTSERRGSSRGLVTVAAAAEAHVETTAAPVDAGPINVRDLKTGVAHVYGVRGSPDKFRRVIDKIRGRSYADALYNLTKLPYRAVEEITEVLKSAANNAANNQGASKTDLIVSECFVDMGGHYKRFTPRAKGRPFKIQIKKSHLTVKVTEVPQQIRQKLIKSVRKK